MIFDSFNINEAQGIILAHTIKTANGIFKKGIKLTSQHIAQLRQAGYGEIIGAKLFSADIDENSVAHMLASQLGGDNTRIGIAVGGRCHIYATKPGLAKINKALVDTLNQQGGDIAIATLAQFAAAEQDQALASVKVIPFAIDRQQLRNYQQLASNHDTGIELAPYQALKVALVQTHTINNSVNQLNKTLTITQHRLNYLGGTLCQEFRCQHEPSQLNHVLKQVLQSEVDLVLIVGATATVDRNDVIPRAIVNCGGTIEHFGMPVEPGNLLLTAQHQDCPIVVLPGCARAVHANGLDFILPRIFAGQPLTKNNIMAMGVGGLLKDNKQQPNWARQPIKQTKKKPRVAGIILAAGTSRRMSHQNKLLAPIAGQPMVMHVVNAARESALETITVVTGHQSAQIAQLLDDKDLIAVFNPDHASGMATSLICGLASIDVAKTDAVLILLADMPFVSSDLINQLISAFDVGNEQDIVAPLFDNRRGNPVLWSVAYLDELMKIVGDSGGRKLLNKYAEKVKLIATSDDASIIDIDTPETLTQWQTLSDISTQNSRQVTNHDKA